MIFKALGISNVKAVNATFVYFLFLNLSFANSDQKISFLDQKIAEIKLINTSDPDLELTYKTISYYKKNQYLECSEQATKNLNLENSKNVFNSFDYMYGVKCFVKLDEKNKLKTEHVKSWLKIYFDYNADEITKNFHGPEMALYLDYRLKLSEVLFEKFETLDLNAIQIDQLVSTLKRSKKNEIKSKLFLFLLNKNEQEEAKSYLLESDPKLLNLSTLKVLSEYFKDDIFSGRIADIESSKKESRDLKNLYNRKKNKEFLSKIAQVELVKKKELNLASRQLGWLFVRGCKEFKDAVVKDFDSYHINPHQFFWVLSNQGYFAEIISTYNRLGESKKEKHLSMALKAYLYSGQYPLGYKLVKSKNIIASYENTKPAILFYSTLILLRLNKNKLALNYCESLIKKDSKFKLQALYIKYNLFKEQKNNQYKTVAKDLVALYPLTFYGLVVAHVEKLTSLLPFIGSAELNPDGFKFELKDERRKLKHMVFLFDKELDNSFRKFMQNTVYSLSFESQILWAYQYKIENEPLNAIKLMNQVWTSRQDLIHPDVIPIAYPKDYLDSVKKHSVSGIDPYLVLGLIRQESAFQKNAKSASSARGLMQLLTGTAREMARSLRMRSVSLPWGLYTPEINIKLGSFYLQRRISAYKGHVPLALASYNVGPGRLSKWSSDRNIITVAQENISSNDWREQDLWVEEMPWNETRFYVKAVLRNYLLYKIFENYKPLKECFRIWNCHQNGEIDKTANKSSRSFRKY